MKGINVHVYESKVVETVMIAEGIHKHAHIFYTLQMFSKCNSFKKSCFKVEEYFVLKFGEKKYRQFKNLLMFNN